jgi:hypothetical protein
MNASLARVPLTAMEVLSCGHHRHFACHGHTYEYHYPALESMVLRYSPSIYFFGIKKMV